MRTPFGDAKKINQATPEQRLAGWKWWTRVPAVTEEGEDQEGYWYTALQRVKDHYTLRLVYATGPLDITAGSTKVLFITDLPEKYTTEQAFTHAYALSLAVKEWLTYFAARRKYLRDVRIKAWTVYAYNKGGHGWGMGSYPLKADAVELVNVLKRLHSLSYCRYEIKPDDEYVYDVTPDEIKMRGYEVVDYVGPRPKEPEVPNPFTR